MAAIVGIDDTDSRTAGMCTTYVGTVLRQRLVDQGIPVHRQLLYRCHPAVKRKTRGNAAVGLHVEADPATILPIAREVVETHAVIDDDRTNPGLVIAPHGPDRIPAAVATFARNAVQTHQSLSTARSIAGDHDYHMCGWGDGHGHIGALAAVGAWDVTTEWTYEQLTYREPDRWGTPRTVDTSSVFAAADRWYPRIWDTVDRTADEAVCVPHTPGPVLYGLRGDDPAAITAAAEMIDSEPTSARTLFHTNQGTDAHLRDASLDALVDGHCYRTTGRVVDSPVTQRGGHVFVTIRGDDGHSIECAAFEPTKRFRDHVRALHPGDRITVCGEYTDGTMKLEKFAVRELTRTTMTTPSCPTCDRTMSSAGADQGYRCPDCDRTAPGKVEQPLDRSLSCGWYEVPPLARRHIAKPLVRGGFDAPIHPER